MHRWLALPGALAALVLVPAPALATHGGGAPNDARSAATVVSTDPPGAAAPVDTQAAGVELGEPLTTPNDGVGCTATGALGLGGSDVKRTVWYRVVAPVTGEMTVSARGSVAISGATAPAAPHDVVVAVYATSGMPSAANFVECGRGASATQLAGEVTFVATAATTYLVQVGTWNGVDDGNAANGQQTSADVGDVTLATIGPLVHDERAQAADLTTPGQDNLGAGIEPAGEDTFCDDGGDPSQLGSTLWYRLTLPSISDVTFTAGPFNTVIQLYAGDAPQPFACNDDAGPPGDRSSRLVQHDLAPGTYLLQVGGWRGTQGATLDVRADVVDRDVDRDGFTAGADCDDGDAGEHPGAVEVIDNGVDDDGDGVSAATPPPPAPVAAPEPAQTAPPPSDRDGDGIADASDACPGEDARGGDRNRNGCLDGSVIAPGRVSLRARPARRGIRVLGLRVDGTARGSRISASCTRRHACPRQSVDSRGGRLTLQIGRAHV
jgi:hypothetical protein